MQEPKAAFSVPKMKQVEKLAEALGKKVTGLTVLPRNPLPKLTSSGSASMGIKHNHLNFIVTPYEKAFTNWIIEAARGAGLPPHRSPHGLRKAACHSLAEAGCTALEITSITGHPDIKEIEIYCAAVNKKRLA